MSESELVPRIPRRRRLALHLRTLMLLILLVAAGLGWKVNRARIQTRAVARIEKAGGYITYDYTFSGEYPHKLDGKPWAPAWSRQKIGDAYFQEVTAVSLYAEAADDDLAAVEDLDRLIAINLCVTQVTDAGLAHLCGLKHLRALFLLDDPITDAALAQLARLSHLEKLHVSSSGTRGVTNAGLAHLAKLTRLRDLDVSGGGITDAGMAHLKPLGELQRLKVGEAKVNGNGLAHLAGLTRLRTLDLASDPITDQGLEHLKGLTQLEELGLMGAYKVSDAGLVCLEGLKNLHKLDLSGTLVTDAGLVHLAKLTKLRVLNLSVNEISDLGLAHLRGLHQLRKLELDQTKVSAAGIATLTAAIPKLSVSQGKGLIPGPVPARQMAFVMALRGGAGPNDPPAPAKPVTRPPVVAPVEAPPRPENDEAPARQEPDGTLLCSGRVFEKGTNKRVAGATVTVERFVKPDTETGGKRVLEETKDATDAHGKYHFRVLPEQLADPRLAIVLRVEHPDYPSADDYQYDLASIPKRVRLGDSPSFDVDLTPGKPVTGVVETPEGKPAAGVLVHSVSYCAPEAKSPTAVMTSSEDTRTDDQGRFRLVVVTPGEAELTLYPEHRAVTIHALGDKRGDLGRFVLQKGIALKGTVLDADAAPLAGVTVNVGYLNLPPGGPLNFYLGSEPSATLSRSAVTDVQGAFALAPLPPGLYRVQPVELDRYPLKGETFRQLPEPFAPTIVTLKEGETPPPLVLRGLPHVDVEAWVHDSEGKPVLGPAVLLSGNLEGQVYWSSNGWPDATGKIVIHPPRGLERASLSLWFGSPDSQHALRYRPGKDKPLHYARDVKLASLDRNVKDIDIIVYESPTLIVKVAAGDGSTPKGAGVTAIYPAIELSEEDKRFRGRAPRCDVWFSEQSDGRFCSQRLLPDERVMVTASAVGYKPRSVSLKLPEGSIKELELVLDKP